jgi:dolichol-phosphate mannosyltransferase
MPTTFFETVAFGVRSAPVNAPRLSIIVPVYNEEGTLPSIVERVYAACGDFSEVIFVDDGSRDRSLSILRSCARPQDTVLTKPNGGKGSAVRMGYEHANGQYTIVQDADLEYDPADIPVLLAAAEAKKLPALFGSRRLKRQKQFAHVTAYIGGTLLTGFCNLLYRTHLTDQPTCYKLVRTDIIKRVKLKENDFRFDPELTVLLSKNGIHIAELPISYYPRSRSEGKKINWKDWFRWMWVFCSLRVAPRSRWELRAVERYEEDTESEK